jgi:hypothetical protein
MDTAFQADAFQNDAFQIASAAPPDPTGGGPGRRRARIYVEPPAQIEEVTDDGWIHIIL